MIVSENVGSDRGGEGTFCGLESWLERRASSSNADELREGLVCMLRRASSDSFMGNSALQNQPLCPQTLTRVIYEKVISERFISSRRSRATGSMTDMVSPT
jgi:hypothetical protein